MSHYGGLLPAIGERMHFCTLSRVLTGIALLLPPGFAVAQERGFDGSAMTAEVLPEAPLPQDATAAAPASNQKQPAGQATAGATEEKRGTDAAIPASKKQPKRILGIMPNYRAVSAGEIPPPPTPRQAFKIATQNSFDYSSFLFVGVTSLMAEGSNAHPQLGKGVAGFWGYTWRGFVDKTDGNYLVLYALPTMFHQDERYFAKGEGSILKRAIYAGSRVLITPDYHGRNGFNTSEILGRGIAEGISLSYYPSSDRNVGDLSEKYGYAIGRDALTNVFREFWPDIAAHLLHRHKKSRSEIPTT